MTLTELSYWSRKFLPFIVIGFILFLIVFYALRLTFLYLGLKKPTLYTNTIFGPIKKPYIANATSSAQFSLSLDTIEGEPISATRTAKIYFLPEAATRFGYREKIYLIANTFGFNTQIVRHQLDGKEARFSDFAQDLSVDITNFNFTYKYKFEKNAALFAGAISPSKEVAENKAVDFLKTVGRYPDELATGKRNVIYLKYDPITNEISETQRVSEANMVEVDFYRPDVEADPSPMTIVSPAYFNSQNYVIMVMKEKDYNKEFKILRAQVRFFEKSDAQVGIYPLKTGDVAWQQLKDGKGIVVSTPKNLQKVVIKKMDIAYFDPDVYQEYLQPVYFFLGENNFVAYVPAVLDSYSTDR